MYIKTAKQIKTLIDNAIKTGVVFIDYDNYHTTHGYYFSCNSGLGKSINGDLTAFIGNDVNIVKI